MVTSLLKKSYRHKDLKEIKFHDLWNSYGVFTTMRIIGKPFKSNNIKISMRCAKTNIPMGIEDLKNNIYGFQFHPESFLTENGNFIIKKILST